MAEAEPCVSWQLPMNFQAAATNPVATWIGPKIKYLVQVNMAVHHLAVQVYHLTIRITNIKCLNYAGHHCAAIQQHLCTDACHRKNYSVWLSKPGATRFPMAQ